MTRPAFFFQQTALIFWVVQCCLFVAACSSATSVENKYRLDPPPPELVQKTVSNLLEADMSYIRLPVHIDLKAIERIVNEQVPALIQELDGDELRSGLPRITARQIKITREGPIQVSSAENRLQLGFDIRIAGNAEVDLKLTAPQYPVDIRSRIVLYSSLDIGQNWQLMVNTMPTVTVSKPLSISILGYEIPFKEQTQRLLQTQLQSLAPQIDADISKQINLRQQMESVWGQVQTPFSIPDLPTKMWTYFKPIELAYAPLETQKGRQGMLLYLVIKAKMGITVGQEMPYIAPQTLPPPQKIADLTANGTVVPLSEVNMPVVMQLDSIEPYLKPQIVGQTIQVPLVKEPLYIRDIDLSGGGDKIVVRAAIESNLVKGNVYMMGVPVLDLPTKVLRFNDFEYTLETGNMLKNKASWLLNKLFLQKIAEKMQYDLSPVLTQAKDALQQKLNEIPFAHGTLNGKILLPETTGLTFSNNVVRVNIAVKGSLAATVK